jgi:hypothetical protein
MDAMQMGGRQTGGMDIGQGSIQLVADSQDACSSRNAKSKEVTAAGTPVTVGTQQEQAVSKSEYVSDR